MDMTIDQEVALDKALVVYDVLRLTLFYKAFLVTTDVPETCMQEFWATAIVHHHLIRFKMNNKKRIINLEYFKEMLHISPRIPNQIFNELPFEVEILAFLRYLGHSGEIKKITDVNINKLHQPWRSFDAFINKCLSGKSTATTVFVKHKDAKKSNEMYYPRFTKVIINFFMTKDPSILRRNKFGAMFPVELTNEDIRNSAAYKEYYAISSGAAPPKTKAGMRKMQSSSDTTMPPPTVAGIRISTSAKGKQPAKSSKAKGLTVFSEVALTEAEQINEADDDEDDQEDEDKQDDDDQDDNNDDQDADNDDDDFVHPKLSTHDEEAKDEESFDLIVQTLSQVENADDKSNDDASHDMNVGGEEGLDAEDDDKELYRDVNINLKGQDVQMTDSLLVSSQFVTSMFNPTLDIGIDSLFESTHMVNALVSTTVVPLLVTAPTLPPPFIPIMSQVQQVPAPTPTTTSSSLLQDLINFGSLFGFDHHLKTLEANFSKFMQTNQFARAVSSIPAQAKNEDFLNKLDENIQKIIKEQVNEQVKTSYVVAAGLSELELKKILIDKMESNKSIHRSNEQRNLYKALVDAYECDKIILDTYGDTVTLKRRRDDADKDEEPYVGSDQGSKRRREGKEPESTSAPKEKAYKTIATHESIQPWISDLAKQADTHASFNELMDTPVDFSAFLMNQLNVDTLTPELLVGPTYELMKGSCKSLVKRKFFFKEVYKATTDQLDWNNLEGHQYPHNLLKPLPLIPNSRGLRVIPFDHFINNDLKYLCGGASSRKLSASFEKYSA
uniref:Retrovirus-related Pol polyprotein from transposon TNT 1-94 n=1 Tax=Tanacetum cinerariifolium TaxID=118510 RepID=A0A699HUG7_TANCI|nr:hypothetical protein [Tanacetum cinerariifolium]